MFHPDEFFEAAREGNLDRVRTFIETQGTPVDKRDDDQRTAVHWAAAGGHVELLRYLLGRGAAAQPSDESGWTPLMSASSAGRAAAVRVLAFDSSVDVNAVNERGCTALHYACSKGHAEAASLLLQKGARVAVKDSTGMTPLHRAVSGGPAIVELLLSNGASVDARNKSGETALHIAAQMRNIDTAVALLKHGASMDVEDEDGKTPIALAKGEFREELAEAADSLTKK
eukprot:m51a1_g761 hypothetical protein (228) ;mRNA; r:555311-556321